ncbi:hypothetical protein [Mycolicibacterium sp. GF69]|uniref:hypothetical protein n=1 Tax=Mycolicibacterium sp. GF69 TaxID=2267251 RepID=UPI001058279A|nr:hypothetical protein [Mycolicibacterium sp. GF69]
MPAFGPLDGRSGEELRGGRAVDDSRSGLVADRPEPKVVTGLLPETAGPGALPDESASAVDEAFVVEAPVDPGEVLLDSVDEPVEDPVESVEDPVEPVEVLEDDCPESSGAATAVPIPPVPTNPATPSEKAIAPIRNACFAEFTRSRSDPEKRETPSSVR